MLRQGSLGDLLHSSIMRRFWRTSNWGIAVDFSSCQTEHGPDRLPMKQKGEIGTMVPQQLTLAGGKPEPGKCTPYGVRITQMAKCKHRLLTESAVKVARIPQVRYHALTIGQCSAWRTGSHDKVRLSCQGKLVPLDSEYPA